MELNRIYNYDCYTGMEEMVREGMKVDLILTDPHICCQMGKSCLKVRILMQELRGYMVNYLRLQMILITREPLDCFYSCRMRQTC